MTNETSQETSSSAPAAIQKKRFSFAAYWSTSIIALFVSGAIMLGIKVLGNFQNQAFINAVFFATALLAISDVCTYIWWHSAKRNRGAIVIHSYPDFVYVWPLIAAGVIFFYLGQTINPVLTGWIYLTLAATVLVTIGYDLNRNYSIFWILLISLIWVICLWLKSAKGVVYFEEMGNAIKNFPMEYSPSFGWALSVVLALIYLIMLIEVRLNQRWRLTNNEIEHKSFGFSNDSLARSAKRVTATYPDILELILLGSGTLTIYSAQGGQKLREIKNIPFLIFRMRKISKILESMAVSTEDMETDDHGEGHEEGVHE